MQTHCPQCDTLFRVTEEQVNLAGGLVRCGVCDAVFNVLEVTGKTIDRETDDADISDSQSKNELAGAEDNKKIAGDKMREDSLDFFNEEITVSLPHVVPEKFRKQDTSTLYSATSTILWSIGTLLLTTCLLLEYVWFNRDQFNNSPELHAVFEKLCHHIECKNLSMRDPVKIELVARNIYTHPDEKDALMVDLTMKNNAIFSQPYPVMNISFSDIRGKAVAARNFLPNEYLSVENTHNGNTQQGLLQPGASTSLTLEIRDPGNHATTYEFNFM